MRRAEILHSVACIFFLSASCCDGGQCTRECGINKIYCRLDTHNNIAEARIAGLHGTNVAREWGENPYVAVSFPDVARLKFDEETCSRGWVTRLLEELFTIDKAVGIHPVLSADSDVVDQPSNLRSFPFLRTSIRAAPSTYRTELGPRMLPASLDLGRVLSAVES